MDESLRRDRQNIWHPFTPFERMEPPLPLKRAQGNYLYTEDGRPILDAIASWWVNLLGHCHPHIVQAVQAQAAQMDQIIFAGFTHEPALRLAEEVLALMPEGAGFGKVFYSDDGSTAVEVALKMAFQYWHNRGEARTKVLALDGAYHGDTFGAMSVAERNAFSAPFAPFLFDVHFLPLPDEQGHEAALEQMQQWAESGEVAAFIFEPLVQGASGMRMYPAEHLNPLLEVARQHQVLTIADEVMTGFGRTGTAFASEQLGHFPDILCLSKGITGGFLPLGATVCKEFLTEPFRDEDLLKTFFHGHSYTANPLACAAGVATLELLRAEEGLQMRHGLYRGLEKLKESLAALGFFRNLRQMGGILAMDYPTEEATSYINEARNALYNRFLSENLLMRPLGNVLYVLPPFSFGEGELAKVADALKRLAAEG